MTETYPVMLLHLNTIRICICPTRTTLNILGALLRVHFAMCADTRWLVWPDVFVIAAIDRNVANAFARAHTLIHCCYTQKKRNESCFEFGLGRSAMRSAVHIAVCACVCDVANIQRSVEYGTRTNGNKIMKSKMMVCIKLNREKRRSNKMLKLVRTALFIKII